MDNPIVVQCQNEYDPPMAAITVAGVFVGSFPIGDYNKIKGPLGLPNFPCTETFEG